MHKFIDEATITIRSGNGGAGCVSFRREKYVPKGGPDGGDGGKGGDVIFITDPKTKTLYDFRRKSLFAAKNGQPGMGRNKSGEKGAPAILHVPVGTMLKDKENGEIIADLDKPNMQFIAAHGGLGGKGNQHFATSVNQTPRYAQSGLPGEEREYFLELKLIADVGLVGFPNAGKSTLLKALTRAHPKIGAYPFTTLNPNLGVAHLNDKETFIIADIPGIIEGASQGKGLGVEFLKHIERTRVLLLVVDFFTDDPEHSEKVLLNELASFSNNLTKKPIIKLANKIDLPEAREKAEQYKEYMPISGAAHMNTDKIVKAIAEAIATLNREQ